MITVHIWHPVNSLLDSPATLLLGTVADFANPASVREAMPEQFRPPVVPEFSRYGHAGIEFHDVRNEDDVPYPDAYRAFWPARNADWTTPATGRVVNSMDADVHDEGGDPSRSISLNEGLNEALVYRYWQSLSTMPLEYSAAGFNCCTSVAVSIRDGFPMDRMRDAPRYSPLTFAGAWFPWAHSNPYYLEEWIEEINEWI